MRRGDSTATVLASIQGVQNAGNCTMAGRLGGGTGKDSGGLVGMFAGQVMVMGKRVRDAARHCTTPDSRFDSKILDFCRCYGVLK